jgi:hypothetical protein
MLLNKSLNIYDVKRTMFCLSFPSRDRVTEPGLIGPTEGMRIVVALPNTW